MFFIYWEVSGEDFPSWFVYAAVLQVELGVLDILYGSEWSEER